MESTILNNLFNKSGNKWISKHICFSGGHPVDVCSGKMFTDHIDFEIPGILPFNWERSYYSCSPYKGPLGFSWHHKYDLFLDYVVSEEGFMLNTEEGTNVPLPDL
jgi:hypothetical protein